MRDFPRQPKITGSPSIGYTLYLDSPLGYEPQGWFESMTEAEEYVESLREHEEDVPSLW
jgi:hypothetical protein